MKPVFSFLALICIICSVSGQNPICPQGLNIADPTARVWKDGKLYVYGSRDESFSYYCSYCCWFIDRH